MHEHASSEPDGPAGSSHEGDADARPGTGAVHVEALELMSGLLLNVAEGSPPDAFFSSLCEAICDLTSMRRAVLFRYDSAHQRVRAVGAHGISLERFADLFVTVDSVPVARRALGRDRVLETHGTADFDVPSALREPFEDALIVCTPMAAARRYVGVVLSERDAAAPPMGEDERNLLWTLGKAVAMASVAREVTASDERSRQLQQRIDLAREIHEGVVQRLFGVSLALSQATAARSQTSSGAAPRRCRRRSATCAPRCSARSGTPRARPTVTFAEELARLRGLYPELEIRCRPGAARRSPRTWSRSPSRSSSRRCATRASTRAPARGGLAAQRRAARSCSRCATTAPSAHSGGRGGIGLRLATLRGPAAARRARVRRAEPGTWQVRLVVPTGQQGDGARGGASAVRDGTAASGEELGPARERAAAEARDGR